MGKWVVQKYGNKRDARGRHFETVHMLFLFVTGFFNLAIGFVLSARMTRVQTLFAELVIRQMNHWDEGEAGLMKKR